MVRYIISIVILFTGISCNTESKKEILSIRTLDISNEDLTEEIISFMEEVDPPSGRESNSHPYLTIKYLNTDTVVYRIDYFGGPLLFYHHAIAFFVQVGEDYIPVEIEEMMHSSEFFFRIKDEEIMQYCKRYFPKEYAYYQENGEWPVPPTSRDRYRVLTFKGDKLINKEDRFD
ncbi:hypothetical protein [Marinilabilia salmonicolor]|uniref:hypothetical protein n=1 Tax=Marinilabilia salmonicolor TaxID=989 RepID=UPI00029A25BA|nr:hypothetical protein [Marinilabilia salmonicolor]